jgi:hypothetical protein
VARGRLPGPAGPGPARPMPPLGRRELPAAPLLAHWGWQVATSFLRQDGAVVGPETVLQDVVLPSFRASADVLDLHLPDRSRGYPLAWSKQDPLHRPGTYRGELSWPEWSPEAIGRLCHEAHARGMLVQALLWPAPAAGGTRPEHLAGLRFLGRELMDVRRLGAAALDGVGLHDRGRDPHGLLLAMVQDFQPSAHVYAVGARPVPVGGAVRAVDADDGRPAGLNAAGISDGFRAGYPGDLYPAATLDARGRRPDVRRWADDALGGGAYPDWIAMQCNDFVRARQGAGAALWWRAHDPDTFAPGAEAAVLGVSLDPVRAAVAGRHLATGQGGWRELQRGFATDVQPGFGAELPLPAGGPFLQNNWIKLCGSGGSLLYDPEGLGRFRPGQAAMLAQELVRTRLTGHRPSTEELRTQVLDVLERGTRPEGGHGREAVVGPRVLGDGRMPAVLARGEAPAWPEAAVVDLELTQGLYRLELALRGLRGRGIVEVALDGEVLHLCAFAEGSVPAPVRIPLHLARPGARALRLQVADGGAVAVDRLLLERVQDAAAEAEVGIPAGHCASLRESSSSTYHHERVELFTLADFPGFLWRAECRRASRGLRMERSLRLLHHRQLDVSTDGEPGRALRGPFVLRGEGGLPDLAVVPLQLGRYDRFELHEGGELRLSTLAEDSTLAKVGFVLLQEGRPELRELVRLFAAMDRPTELELPQGTARLLPELPFAWTRLLRVQQGWKTPYLVRENGWWLVRGAQPHPDGGDFLRICHLPGDTVELRGGPALLGGTRPGPGSARLLALRDPRSGSVTVRVLQESRLLPMPSVAMGADFDEVRLDGRTWSAFDGRVVLLPPWPGIYRVETGRSAGGPGPRIAATSARLQHCAWDPERRELVFLARAAPDRPADLPLTALVVGAEVLAVENGARVPEAEFRFRDPEQAAAAAAGGTVIRFLPGRVRVHCGPEGTR